MCVGGIRGVIRKKERKKERKKDLLAKARKMSNRWTMYICMYGSAAMCMRGRVWMDDSDMI